MQAKPCRGPIGINDARVLAITVPARDMDVTAVTNEVVERVEGLRTHRSQR